MELNGILDSLYARYQERQPDSIPYVFTPPATPEDIAAAEAALGMSLPEELRALYARHAYMMDAWGGVSITAVQSLAASRASLAAVASSMVAEARQEGEPAPLLAASGPVAAAIDAPWRIPFASENCCDLLIDLDPPAGGTPGQIIRLDIESGTVEVVAGSLTEFFAQGLETFSSETPSPQPGGLVAWVARGAGVVLALVTTAFSAVLVLGIVAWSAASIAAEGIASLLRRKQD